MGSSLKFDEIAYDAKPHPHRIRSGELLITHLEHPFSRAFMLIHEAILGWLGDDWETMHHCAQNAVQLCRHHGFPFWLAVGQILQSWSPKSENPTPGITDLLGFISDYQQTGAGLWRPVFLAILAQAYAETGQTSVAQRYLEEAKNQSEQSGERIWINALLHIISNSIKQIPTA